MLQKTPVILLIIIVAVALLNPILPFGIKQLIYSISLSIKAVIIFLLPFIIFSLLFKVAAKLSSDAPRIIMMILAVVACSNFLSTMTSYVISRFVYNLDLSLIAPKNTDTLVANSFLVLPTIIANNHAMLLGIISATILTKYKPVLAAQVTHKLEYYSSMILRFFIYIIPVFVAGFVIKLEYEGVLSTIIKDYSLIFLIIALAQFSYVIFIYYILANFKFSECLKSFKNILPAAIAGFSTMSSAASMPLTIIGAEKNAINRELARSVIPVTVNIHLIGDCFAIPIFAYAILRNYEVAAPDFLTFMNFVCYFVVAKFSVAAIPGGGIIVMLPILEKYLNFNADMMSLITALYILFDPVITSANILGNGAFARMIDKSMQIRQISR